MPQDVGIFDHVPQAVIAKVFGVTAQTIRQWREQGCPCVEGKTGQRHKFHLPDVVQWRESMRPVRNEGYSAQPVEPLSGDFVSREEAERLKVLAQANRENLKLSKERGEVVPIEEIVPPIQSCMKAAAVAMTNMANSISPKLVGRDAVEIRADLNEAVRSAMQDMADKANEIIASAENGAMA